MLSMLSIDSRAWVGICGCADNAHCNTQGDGPIGDGTCTVPDGQSVGTCDLGYCTTAEECADGQQCIALTESRQQRMRELL